MESRPTIVKSVVESADSGIELADSTADSATNPLRIGLWVLALKALAHCTTKNLIRDIGRTLSAEVLIIFGG